LSLPSMREYVKAVLENYNLDSALHDLYETDVSTDLDSFIETADAGALQLLLIDAVLGSALEVSWYDVKRGDDTDDGFATVKAMARHEGIDVDAVRAEFFPPAVEEAPAAAEQAAIDVTNMQYDDLVEFLKAKPEQINELKAAVLACMPRYDLIGLLEQAAGSLGYVYQVGGFVLASEQAVTDVAPAASDVEQAIAAPEDAPARAEPASEPAVIEAAAAVDQVPAAGTEPAPAKGTKAKAAPAAAKKATVTAAKPSKAGRKTAAEAVA
jgi:hypothetical protein